MSDLAALRQEARARGFYERPTARILGELALHLAASMVGIGLCAAVGGPWGWSAGMVLMTLGGMGLANNVHNSSHHTTSRLPWLDSAITYFGYPFFLLVSATYWRRKHLGAHHPSPNVVGVDPDIEFRGWLRYTDCEQGLRNPLLRAPRPLRYLGAMIVLALFLPALQVGGAIYVAAQLRNPQGRRRSHIVDALAMLLGLVAWMVVPLFFFPVLNLIAFHVVRHVLLSWALAAAFGPAHWPAEAVAVDQQLEVGDPILLWTATSVDFRTGPIGRRLCAGLEYHVEHHLFPEISYVHYPALQPLVEEYCRKNGYPYRRLSWGQALRKSLANLVDGKPVAKKREELMALGAPGAARSA